MLSLTTYHIAAKLHTFHCCHKLYCYSNIATQTLLLKPILQLFRNFYATVTLFIMYYFNVSSYVVQVYRTCFDHLFNHFVCTLYRFIHVLFICSVDNLCSFRAGASFTSFPSILHLFNALNLCFLSQFCIFPIIFTCYLYCILFYLCILLDVVKMYSFFFPFL